MSMLLNGQRLFMSECESYIRLSHQINCDITSLFIWERGLGLIQPKMQIKEKTLKHASHNNDLKESCKYLYGIEIIICADSVTVSASAVNVNLLRHILLS